MRASRLLFVFAFALGATGAGATIHHFTVPSIDGAQETPPNGSSATGSGVFDLDDVTGIATFNITYTVASLTDPESAAHVHTAPPGVPGPIQYFLPGGSPKIGSSPVLTPMQQADMIAGNHYVNIHSFPAFPAGEIRGQIIKTGATQFVPTKVLLVKDPGPATMRKILYLVKAKNPNSLVVSGNPMTGGAKLKVKLDGNTQCFDMPALGWSATGTVGFRYKDPQFVNGPVKVGRIKKSGNGVFLAKFVIQSKVHPITVVPPNPGLQGDTHLTVGANDSYCGSTAGGVLSPNNDTTFKAKDAPAPTSCGVTPCSPSGAFLDEILD